MLEEKTKVIEDELLEEELIEMEDGDLVLETEEELVEIGEADNLEEKPVKVEDALFDDFKRAIKSADLKEIPMGLTYFQSRGLRQANTNKFILCVEKFYGDNPHIAGLRISAKTATEWEGKYGVSLFKVYVFPIRVDLEKNEDTFVFVGE